MTQYRKELFFFFNVFFLRFTLSTELFKVKHWVKKDLAGVNSLGIQFSVERKRDFFFKEWGFDVPSLLESVQGCEWHTLLAASPPLSSAASGAAASLPALRRPCTFCFIIKRICIGYTLKFSSHKQTVLSADICICMITYHHFPSRRERESFLSCHSSPFQGLPF